MTLRLFGEDELSSLPGGTVSGDGQSVPDAGEVDAVISLLTARLQALTTEVGSLNAELSKCSENFVSAGILTTRLAEIESERTEYLKLIDNDKSVLASRPQTRSSLHELLVSLSRNTSETHETSNGHGLLGLIDGLKTPEIGQEDLEYVKNSVRQHEQNEIDLENNEKRDAPINARIPRSLREEMKRAARDAGMSQEDWLIHQISSGVEGQASIRSRTSPPMHVEFAGLSTNRRVQKKPFALSLEPSLAEAVNQAHRAAGFAKNDWLRAAIVKSLSDGLDVQEILEPSAAPTAE